MKQSSSNPHPDRFISVAMIVLMLVCAAIYFLLPNRGEFFAHIWAWVLSWR